MGVKLYARKYENEWNEFVGEAANSTFLFHRSYMNYHADRFKDHSLLYYEDGILRGVLPANIIGNTLYSHQGLTYGGFVLKDFDNQALKKRFIESVLKFLSEMGITKLILKEFPPIYIPRHLSSVPIERNLAKVKVERVDISTIVNIQAPLNFNTIRKKCIRRAGNVGLTIVEEASIPEFWGKILEPNLWNRHQVKPTHTVEEIQLLKKAFPENIIQYNVYDDQVLVAGATLYFDREVVHTQYLSANSRGKQIGALDLLIAYFISDRYNHSNYLSFGISTFNKGKELNSGLLNWKMSFGGEQLELNHYCISTIDNG